ncbi:MAG: methyltransferase domain-containing protein [Methanoregula sp.]|jgi:ubiquinone/menaquinone biosynthesis C-methylase UbiE|nr:methyltransferase domain-containing protein [Methanoregula sp.]
MTSARRVFDECAGDYDQWFDDHREIHAAQVRLLQAAVPQGGCGLELGVGSGRFAAPLGIRYGIDPSPRLLAIAQTRGTEVVQGEGEHLPYRADTFGYVLMMTVICFLDDPQGVLQETFRVLVRGGYLVLGFMEKNGEIALQYRQEKTKGRFLRFARFLTADEVARLMEDAGFSEISGIRRARGFCVMKGRKTTGYNTDPTHAC